MTALTQYQRLETFGIWHASPSQQRRDVVVQLGDATLTICDQNMQPLSHWSLPAIQRLNAGRHPAVFAPGPDMPEMLELEDETMVAALEKVQASLRRRRARPRRLRRRLLGGLALAGVLAAALWLPGALVRQAVAVVPPAKRAELGAALLAEIERSAGAPCDGVLGRRALERLRLRLLPGQPGRIVVLREGVQGAQVLPGRLIVLNRALVEAGDDPAALAATLLAADQSRREADPLGRLLREAGALATVQLLATGGLSPGYLVAHARSLLATPFPAPEPGALAARLAAAGLPAPADLVSADLAPAAPASAPPSGGAESGAAPSRPLMADSDWVSLQEICDG